MSQTDHHYYTIVDDCKQYNATLAAVSKTRTIEETNVLYNMGQRVFAENRAQELIAKAPEMADDIEWHLIGHLQTNKVRNIMPFVHCIQSLDSARLFNKINSEALRVNKQVICLLQIKLSKEESKSGWSYDALNHFLREGHHNNFDNISIEGIMGMTTLTTDQILIREELRQLKGYYDKLKTDFFSQSDRFNTLSMGMSGDYKIALEEGSTMVRIGSLLFS